MNCLPPLWSLKPLPFLLGSGWHINLKNLTCQEASFTWTFHTYKLNFFLLLLCSLSQGVSYPWPIKEERKSYYSSPTMDKKIPRINWSKLASVLPYLVYNAHWKTCKDPFGFNPNMLPSDWNYPPSGCDYKNNCISKRSMENIKIKYFFILIKRPWRKLQNHFYFLPTAKKI